MLFQQPFSCQFNLFMLESSESILFLFVSVKLFKIFYDFVNRSFNQADSSFTHLKLLEMI